MQQIHDNVYVQHMNKSNEKTKNKNKRLKKNNEFFAFLNKQKKN